MTPQDDGLSMPTPGTGLALTLYPMGLPGGGNQLKRIFLELRVWAFGLSGTPSLPRPIGICVPSTTSAVGRVKCHECISDHPLAGRSENGTTHITTSPALSVLYGHYYIRSQAIPEELISILSTLQRRETEEYRGNVTWSHSKSEQVRNRTQVSCPRN